MSSSDNLSEALIDERIDAITNTQDLQLWMILDIIYNRGHPTKYERFWEECRKYLEDETAVDDRRHGEHTHLAKAISARNLQVSVLSLSYQMAGEIRKPSYIFEVTKRCPEGAPIPSKQWLRLQFWPKKSN